MRTTARRQPVAAGVVETSILAAALVGLIEAMALTSGRPGVLVATGGLLLGLGLLIGLVMLASEALVARLGLVGVWAAMPRAAAALLVLIPVGGTLFDGARASTLPGASSAPLWFPASGVLALGLAVAIGRRLLAGTRWLSPARARTVVATLVVAFVAVAELANRSLYRTEYAQLHLLLIVAAVVGVAVALRVAAGARLSLRGRRGWIIRGALSAVIAALVLITLRVGLATEADRWVVATRGTHTRHLAAVTRTLLDRDGDGYAAVLGGGDCDDSDPRRYPGARDVPGNGIDEDCDGADAVPTRAPRPPEHLAVMRDSAAAHALRARLAGANLLMISVDALRADIVADQTPGVHPTISNLLARSRWFTNAVAPSSGTDVSVSSLLTGLVDPFVPLERTLFEALHQAGRATHAVLPTEVLRWAPETLLTRGIDRVDRIVNDRFRENVGNYTTSVETTERALAFLDRADPAQPFALWVHYFDVHEHAQVDAADLELRKQGEGKGRSKTERKYRALLELVDQQLARVLARLADRGLAERTIIVFFSDHGESLGEDPRLPSNHGLYVYRALTAVPFAIRVPGVSPARIDEAVTLIDLWPTLEELLGLEPAAGHDGKSLFPHLLPDPTGATLYPDRVLVLNESDQWGVIEWPLKLMMRPRDNLIELYDLAADPDERHNLAKGRPDTVRRLKQRYDQFDRVSFDRSKKGRRWREAQARRRPPR
ncbi:MAG TPA: sulfatase-like hydrolase/transferase [Kofleriaceae bacterium]|nr:sulfatase-like hydrolase/transferase [Kofleriaceae bacterium]